LLRVTLKCAELVGLRFTSLEMGIDITDRKHSEEALKELNETLELRVKERTGERGIRVYFKWL
jgi:hypothetical protein